MGQTALRAMGFVVSHPFVDKPPKGTGARRCDADSVIANAVCDEEALKEGQIAV